MGARDLVARPGVCGCGCIETLSCCGSGGGSGGLHVEEQVVLPDSWRGRGELAGFSLGVCVGGLWRLAAGGFCVGGGSHEGVISGERAAGGFGHNVGVVVVENVVDGWVVVGVGEGVFDQGEEGLEGRAVGFA